MPETSGLAVAMMLKEAGSLLLIVATATLLFSISALIFMIISGPMRTPLCP